MPSSLPEWLLAVAAPVLAIVILVFWTMVQLRGGGVVNIKLKFLGLSLDVRSCSVSERECRERQVRSLTIKEQNNDL